MDRHPPAPVPAGGGIDAAGAPQWLPSPAELDDVELALAGVDLPVSIDLPASIAASAQLALGLVVTDPEGTPLALVRPDRPFESGAATQPAPPLEDTAPVQLTGTVEPMQPAEHGPFRRLRRSVSEVVALSNGLDSRGPSTAGAPLAVLVDQPLQEAHLTAAAASAGDRRVLLLVLAGHGSPQIVDAATLIRTTLLSAHSLPAADVVVVPLARRTDPALEKSRRAAVAAAYLGDPADFPSHHTLSLTDVRDALPVEAVRAVLDAGQTLTPGTFSAPVEALVSTAHRRPDERGLTVLFTGLSGSGKSTLARAFGEAVTECFGRTVTLLDGDVVRRMLSAGLTFSRADRDLNVRRIGFVAGEINRHGGLAVCCPIAPYASTRADVRAMVEAVGAFVLVHVSTPLAECERRDRKGLYAKARAGLIPEFTGISDPYEAPTDADLVIDTSNISVTEGVERVVELLTKLGYLVVGAATSSGTGR